MKPNEIDSLIEDCIEGTLSEANAARLSDLIEESALVRARYWEAASVHGQLEYVMQQVTVRAVTGQTVPMPSASKRWPQWRPLTAAAAGVAFGLFCGGVAWAVVGSQEVGFRVNEVLIEDSFENANASCGASFPARSGRWGGAPGEVLGSGPVEPLEGQRMARLEPAAETTLSYLDQVIDLRNLPLPEEGEVRQIDVTASFHAEGLGFQERYTLRVATFAEVPEEIGQVWDGVPWREMDGKTLTLSKRGLSTPSNAAGWQTLSVLVEAPPEAASVMISLAAGRLDPTAPKTAHYLDDVNARLIIAPRTTHPRNRRR